MFEGRGDLFWGSIFTKELAQIKSQFAWPRAEQTHCQNGVYMAPTILFPILEAATLPKKRVSIYSAVT